ncbi:YciI family protein [Actinosynnema sp. ALI-1.44]|uniref:YciI family protein n=1 Tax=Actinosynnema sp. ALI-1.44 TaxID=1933779 RepID=UPI00192CF0FC|nr:YciI family protein [Actinosynnema sp. ALI-1.44]
MQFVLVVHHGTYPLPGTPGAETISMEDAKAARADWAVVSSMANVTGGPPLGLPKDATTVRVENGSTVRTEGPFLDATSAVGGFLTVEAEDLAAAVAIAAQIPQARLGGAVEVRKIAKYW